MIKKGNKSKNKQGQFLNPQNVPQQISKEMKGKMDKHYKKMKEMDLELEFYFKNPQIYLITQAKRNKKKLISNSLFSKIKTN